MMMEWRPNVTWALVAASTGDAWIRSGIHADAATIATAAADRRPACSRISMTG
jgi:hypothetical protein